MTDSWTEERMRVDVKASDVVADDLVKILETLSRITPNSEAELSCLVANCFRSKRVNFEREVWLNETDRIDLLVGRVGIELKLKDPVSAVTRQLSRYAQSDRIDELLLVTTRRMHRAIPGSLNRKPITVVHVGGYL